MQFLGKNIDGEISEYLNDIDTNWQPADFLPESRNPDFTIEIMSIDLDISIHKLSQCLNAGMNMTFNSYVNEKRIDEIKLEIQKNKNEKLNYLNLAFSKGFNSKSSFNSTFKNLTGKSPSQFQKEMQNSSQK